MDIKWIEDFLYLVETQNFSVAAERRCVTQSAYSRRIKALEDWVGAELFDRSKLPVRVTERGRDFLPYAQNLLAELNQIQTKFRHSRAQAKREMCIITLHTLMLHFMPNMFRDFDFEGTRINITSSLTGFDAYYNQITNGEADLFICYEIESLAERLAAAGFIQNMHIGEDMIVPVLSRELAQEVSWESTASIPHLALSRDSFISIIAQEHMAKYENRFETVYESNLTESLLLMAKQGKGVALLPYSICADELENGSLCVLEGPDLIIQPKITAYYNTKKTNRLTLHFCKHMRRVQAAFAKRPDGGNAPVDCFAHGAFIGN